MYKENIKGDFHIPVDKRYKKQNINNKNIEKY